MTPTTATKQLTGRHWALFADWATATDRTALPATADTILAFLAELPAGPATTRRRIRAIDTAHHTAGHPPPSAAPVFDTLLRPDRPPRYEPALVAEALRLIAVGGWPTGIIGRRDAAVVALICTAGVTRRHLQALHPGPGGDDRPGATLPAMTATELPGTCPACALSRWQRAHATIAVVGWRAVRNQLADLGEAPAGTETNHDCTRPIPWPPQGTGGRRRPLFSPIDRHGAPDATWPLSTRSVTTIVAARLRTATHHMAMPSDFDDDPDTATRGGAWDENDRQRVRDHHKQATQRLAAIDTLVDEADAYAEAILERLNADLNGNTEPGKDRLE